MGILRRLTLLLMLLIPLLAQAQPFPTGPTYGSVNVNGASNLLGGGQLVGNFTGPTTLSSVTPFLSTYTNSSLPGVTSANAGRLAYISDCVNGTQAAPGTGCIAYVDSNGSWRPLPYLPTSTLTVGGQQLVLGGSAATQGTGALIQLAAGAAHVVGHALVYDSDGNAVDSGVVPSGGTGGGGTVSAGTINAIPFYSGTGTTVGPLAIVNNAVLATNGSGVPSEVTTLPSGLTIPSAILSSPSLSSPTFSGSLTFGAATYTGVQTYAASSSGAAPIIFPAGTAPTSPAAGNFWATAAGLFYQAGATLEPLLYSVSTSAPLTGGGLGPSLAISCATCATTTNGGALTAVAPVAISAGGAISIGGQIRPISIFYGSGVTVSNDTIPLIEPWFWTGSGTVNSVTYHTGGTSSPAFTLAVQINGVAVTGCSAISVSSASDTTATCSGGTVTNGQTLRLVISGVTGAPTSAWISLNVTVPPV